MKILASILEKLDWPALLTALAERCFTEAGARWQVSRPFDLDGEEITARWLAVEDIQGIFLRGDTPPIPALTEMGPILRALELGQVLDGDQLLKIKDLIAGVRGLQKFCRDFAAQSRTMENFRRQTDALPQLWNALEAALLPTGELADTASQALARIRQDLRRLKIQIEAKIQGMFTDGEVQKYLQDRFFTVRSERYVIPMTLDGHGRLEGTIFDTSDSGQTLYIEPKGIATLNDQHIGLCNEEKIEMARIFRSLTQRCSEERETLEENYRQIVRLDTLASDARLSLDINARRVTLADVPTLDIRKMRHPIMALSGKRLIPNTVTLHPEHHVLVISGPNAGGKTVVLKTVAILHVMVRAGLMIPADSESQIFLFDELFLEIGDGQNLSADLSTFSGHVRGLCPILENARPRSLVLLDELASGTDGQTGAAIAQAIVEHFATLPAKTIVTTHFAELKLACETLPGCRNASMEFDMESLQPTYRLIPNVPGQSYGIEIAEKHGLDGKIMARARELRGAVATSVDGILEDLTQQITLNRQSDHETQRLRLTLETERAHWERERLALVNLKRQLRDERSLALQETLANLKERFRHIETQWKAFLRENEYVSREKLDNVRQEMKNLLESTQEDRAENLGEEALPGISVSTTNLNVDDRVYVVSLRREGRVLSCEGLTKGLVKVSLGPFHANIKIDDLRKMEVSKRS